MTTDTLDRPALPDTVAATLSPDALAKASRFFTSSLDDIFAELLQNSRRAGATTITATYDPATRIFAIADNGRGLDDPATLLSFGHSGWDAGTASLEDSAGMGFFSLAKRGAVVTSAGPEGRGWRMEVTPDVFRAEGAARVNPCPRAQGTTVAFEIDPDRNHAIERTFLAAAEFVPVRTSFKIEGGEVTELPMTDFLAGALHWEVHTWGRVGVFKEVPRYSAPPNLSFYGRTLRADLPTIRSANLEVRLDIEDARIVQLALPARKEVIETPEWEAAKADALKAMFHYIARQSRHSLPFLEYQRARSLGIDIEEAAPTLSRWVPSNEDCAISDRPGWPQGGVSVPAADRPTLMRDTTVAAEQALAQGIERNEGRDAFPTLLTPNRGYAGYSWYDELPVLDVTGVTLGEGDHVWIAVPEDMLGSIELKMGKEASEAMGGPARAEGRHALEVDRLTLHYEVRRGGGQESKGKLPLQYAIANAEESIEHAEIILLKDRSQWPAPHVVEADLERIVFLAQCDSDADSFSTQHYEFEVGAGRAVEWAMVSECERAMRRLTNAVRQVVRDVPEGTTSLSFGDGTVITLTRSTEPETDAEHGEPSS